jgi:hypothetical protein
VSRLLIIYVNISTKHNIMSNYGTHSPLGKVKPVDVRLEREKKAFRKEPEFCIHKILKSPKYSHTGD